MKRLQESLQAIRTIDVALLLAAVGVIAFCLAVLRHAIPLGVPREWLWEYRTEHAPLITCAVPVVIFVAFACVCFFFGEQADMGTLRPSARWVGLALCVLLAFGIRLGLQTISPLADPAPDDITLVIYSPVATSYFVESLGIDRVPGGVREFMRTFPERMLRFPFHARTHPPGTLLFFWGFHKVFEIPVVTDIVGSTVPWDLTQKQRHVRHIFRRVAPVNDILAAEIVGRAMPFLGALFLLPFFALCRHLWGESQAWRMLLPAATVPGLLLFFPAVDQVYVPIAVTALWLLVKGVDLRRHSSLFASGVWVGVGLMMTLAFLSLGAVMCLFVLLAMWCRKDHASDEHRLVRFWFWGLCLFTAGLLVPVLAAYVLFNVDFLAVLKTGLTAHKHVTTSDIFARTYWKWVWVNLLDFGGGLGFAWVIAMTFALTDRARRTGFLRSSPTVRSLLVAWVLGILALDISGVVRAEVARIWMFLYPAGVALTGLTLAGRQIAPTRATINVHYTFLALLQLLQAIVLQREAWFIRAW